MSSRLIFFSLDDAAVEAVLGVAVVLRLGVDDEVAFPLNTVACTVDAAWTTSEGLGTAIVVVISASSIGSVCAASASVDDAAIDFVAADAWPMVARTERRNSAKAGSSRRAVADSSSVLFSIRSVTDAVVPMTGEALPLALALAPPLRLASSCSSFVMRC